LNSQSIGTRNKSVNSKIGPDRQGRTRRSWRDRLKVLLTSVPLIVLVALGVRFAYAWEQQRSTLHWALSSVPFLYEPANIAHSLAVGKGFSSPFHQDTGPTAWDTPVYPLILAGIFRIFGTFTFSAFVVAVSLNILCSALACVPIFFAGKRIAGIGVAAGAAWLWAIFPNGFIIPFQWIFDTSLSALLAATILCATLKLARSNRARDWCAYGLLWGFALMTNGTLAGLLPFLFGWLAHRAREGSSGQRWLARPALAVGILVLCCVPWTVRNYVVFHSFVPLRSVLGVQLWLGNNDQYVDRFPGWLHPVDNSAERAKYVHMGEIAYMHDKLHQAIHWMLSHPRRELGLFAQRFTATWLGTTHPWRDFRSSPGLLVRAVFVSNFLAALGALAGIMALYQDRRTRVYAFPVAVFPIVFPFAFYLSQALFRYRYPIDPVVILLTAVAAHALLRRFGFAIPRETAV
jgi:hypothetical protein